MITLNVARDNKGRLLILDSQPPVGVRYVFRKPKPVSVLDKKLRVMWKEFDDIVGNHLYGERDAFQQATLKRLTKEHLNIKLEWEKAKGADGWPTATRWPASKVFINKMIRRRLA